MLVLPAGPCFQPGVTGGAVCACFEAVPWTVGAAGFQASFWV